jgi:hypothetical protein
MKFPVTLVLVMAALFGSSGAGAQYLWQAREGVQLIPPPSGATPIQPAQGSGAGLQIFIDPATGKIRPPEQEDLQALARQLVAPQFTPVPQMFIGRDGAVGVRLDASFDSYMVAIKRLDGVLDIDCLPGNARAADAVAAGAKPEGVIQKKATLDEK